ncbi:hypothetical protein [Sulfurospirillum arcachonense]|uniref:hypothetical protein n=1 Tax=Sulfurospirillum arcachonense TaxID=57666 RepID=UPI00046A61C1|nr:hypothetical protein [Sulfurospirillum arcachonense]
MLKIFDKIRSFYKLKLSYQQDSKNIEKLTRWSILLIVILDIFVYSSIQMGIHFQTSTINNPNTKFTYQCLNIVKDSSGVKNYNWHGYRVIRMNQYYNPIGSTLASKNVIRDIRLKELDGRCAHIQEQSNRIANNKKLKNIKKSIKSLKKQSTKYNKALQYIQNNYNTVLFEKMVNQKESKSILKMDLKSKNVKIKYDDLQKQIASTNQSIENLKKQFRTNKLVVNLYKYITTNKEKILSDYKKENTKYFLKKAGIIVLFLLPLALLFYWQMNVQNIKKNYTKYIIFKNIFTITMIFLFINTISIVYSFIPHTFIEKVLMFFYNIQIPFIAYYILLALGIVAFSFIILKLQNHKKNKKKTIITFIESYRFSKCDKCGIKVDYIQMNYCPNCSNTLKIACQSCGKETIKDLDYCFNCSEKIN